MVTWLGLIRSVVVITLTRGAQFPTSDQPWSDKQAPRCRIPRTLGRQSANTERWSRKRTLVSREEQPLLPQHCIFGLFFFFLITSFVSGGTLSLVTGQWSVSSQPVWELEGVPAACVRRVNSCWYYWWTRGKVTAWSRKWPRRHWSVPKIALFPGTIWLLSHRWTETEPEPHTTAWPISSCQTLKCSLEVQTHSMMRVKQSCQETEEYVKWQISFSGLV